MTACAECPARAGTVCGALAGADRDRFRALAREEHRAAGQWVVEPGTRADTVFILRTGLVHVARVTADGKRQILAFLFPGDFFGFTYEPRYVYGAFAATPVLACRLPRDRFEAFVAGTPALDRQLRMQLMRLLDSAQELIFTLGRKTALERVASFLWYLDYRQRKLGLRGPLTPIPMSRADIADFLGLTSESVSRALSGLRREGLVRLPDPGHVEILDMARLRDRGVVLAEPGVGRGPGA